MHRDGAQSSLGSKLQAPNGWLVLGLDCGAEGGKCGTACVACGSCSAAS
jgi:hypothetical protein